MPLSLEEESGDTVCLNAPEETLSKIRVHRIWLVVGATYPSSFEGLECHECERLTPWKLNKHTQGQDQRLKMEKVE